MLTVPFEDVLSPVIWEEVDETEARRTTQEYRVFSLKQADLLKSGMDPQKNRFAGDKWGGKYLRAPDIYWVILEKAGDRLVRLGEVADVRFGIKTGANEFFYLDERKIAEWGIEKEFLRPVVKSPRECKRIVIDPQDLRYKLFMCHQERRELKGTAALEYIEWGESQGFHRRPSCRGRARWWDLGRRDAPPIASPSSYSDMYRAFLNTSEILIDKRLYEVYVNIDDTINLAASLNSTVTTMMFETGSRTGLGEGLVDLTVYEVAACLVLSPSLIRGVLLPTRQILGIHDEIHQSDRRALDDIIFDALGLTRGERDAVYEAVIDLVEARLSKAGSLR